MKKNFWAALVTAAMVPAFAAGQTTEKVVTSPDGQTFLKVGLKDGRVYYEAGYYVSDDGGESREMTLVEESPLGLVANFGDFSRGLAWVSDSTASRDICYDLSRSKTSRVDKKANTFTVRLSNAQKQRMDVEFVVEDENIAFRYFLPKAGETGSVRVMSEATGFRFPERTTTFLTPQSDAMIG